MAALSPPDSAHAIDVCAAEISDMLPLTSIGTIRALCRALAVSIALRKRVPVRISRSGRRIFQPRRYVAETAHAYAVRLEKASGAPTGAGKPSQREGRLRDL